VASGDVAVPAGDPLERSLQSRVLEGLDLSAVVADEVMVMLATGVRGLEARDSVSEVDPLDETELAEVVEGAIHARNADPRRPAAEIVVDLLRGDATVLLPEELDDGSPGPAASTGRCAES
jgi:hypothetical protein